MSDRKEIEEIRGEMDLLERIMNYIPGYRGYKEKELRRESDRLVRMKATSSLRSAKDLLRRNLTNPTIVRKISSEDAWRINALLSRLDRVVQRVDRAVAGYAGMFDAVRVREDKLDSVLQHDLSLIERVEAFRVSVESLVKLEPGGEGWRKEIDELLVRVEELDSILDKRTEIIRGLVK